MNILTRVKNILLSPVKEWEVIDGEKATVKSLYINYAIPLMLIPMLAGTGFLLVGAPVSEPSAKEAVAELPAVVIGFAFSLAVLFVDALIVNALTPKFGGQPNLVQALKVIVYSMTALWIIPLFMIVPALGFYALPQIIMVWVFMVAGICLLALIYWMVLLWLGLPTLMKVPEEKKGAFNIVVLLWLIVLSFACHYVSKRLFAAIM